MHNSNAAAILDVAIVGAGQLGSRYLQGLAKCSNPLRIWVVDPHASSLSQARSRWLEAGGESTAHELLLFASISDLPRHLELALITTSAHVREVVVRDLEKQASVRYWVLEKILAQSSEALSSLLEITSRADGCWVNTPRRMMNWHGQLHAHIGSQHPLHFHVGNSLWGLACNAIHFLDLAAWFCNAPLTSIDTQGLDASWIDSKRPGFFEITGTLHASYADGSTIRLESLKQGVAFEIQIETQEGLWTINEGQAMATGPQGQHVPGRLEFQSEMSTRLVDSILATGQCLLPTLETSVQIHRPFLQAMLAHWNRSGPHNDSLLPVT